MDTVFICFVKCAKHINRHKLDIHVKTLNYKMECPDESCVVQM